MGIYLPIAEMSVNAFVLLAMGAAVGFLSGMFGVGGGFLITPLLIFYNIPPAIAVATGANQVIASSFSGSLAHFKRGTLDFKLGTVLLAGGIVGSSLGTLVFAFLRRIGQLDLVISLIYVIFLGTIGGLMLVESVRAHPAHALAASRRALKKSGQHNWIHRLPLKMRFRTSKLFVSVLPVLALGAAIGFLAAIMGVGGGIIMVPALIYLLKVPTNVVVGTSLFQIIFVAAFTTIVQSTANQTVDIVLALVLMLGGVAGAQYGARAGQKLRGEQLRALLAMLVLAVALRLAFDLFVHAGQPLFDDRPGVPVRMRLASQHRRAVADRRHVAAAVAGAPADAANRRRHRDRALDRPRLDHRRLHRRRPHHIRRARQCRSAGQPPGPLRRHRRARRAAATGRGAPQGPHPRHVDQHRIRRPS